LHGSYERIASGLTMDVFRDLTKAPSFSLNFKEKDPEELWGIIHGAR